MPGSSRASTISTAILHPALWMLLWLDLQGWLRSLARIRKNPRHLLLLGAMLGFVGLLLWMRTLNDTLPESGRYGNAMPFWTLIYLLLTWLTASSDRGLVMRPAEAQFVAGGPFRQRDVITLNLFRLATRGLFSASVLSLVASIYVPSFLSAVVGIWLLISVSLLVGMIAALLAKRSHSRLIKRFRGLTLVAAVVGLWLLVSQSLNEVRAVGAELRLSVIAAAAGETAVGQWVMPPLDWMFRPISSPVFFPDTLLLMPPRLLVVAALIGMVYLLGSNYLEASTYRTDASIAKRQQALRSGAHGQVGWTSRLRLPSFGALGGVGAVAWMQMLHAMRILPRFLVFTIAIVGVVLVLPLMVDAQRLAGTSSIGWMAALTLYADFLLLLQLPVGFLGPVAQREMLKTLPIKPWRIVVGQLAGPLFPLGMLHLLILILFLVLVPDNWPLILLTGLALIPAAWVLAANMNLLGCWNLIRPRALQQRDALAAGRALLSIWFYFAMLLPAIVLAACGAVLAGLLFPGSLSAALLGASLGAGLSTVIYIALIARSFARWQPTAAEAGKEEVEIDR
jgi:hypothetical protein